MKLDINEFTDDIEVIGAGPITSKKLAISPENTPYFISLLTKVYSDKFGSIVREITSNCFDAHVKANVVDEPVIIRHSRDDTGQNFIEFIDQGCGMSPETMDQVYMSLGESDKRDSDDFLGAFGLGSKSPFSYSAYFYLTTRVDGVEYNYLLNETVEGSTADLLSTKVLEDTSLSGTTVKVPIEQGDIGIFTQKIREQLRYFDNVYVVGFDVENKYEIKKFDTFQVRVDLFRQDPTASLHVTYGKVTYPINWDVLGLPRIGVNGALTFEIGELDVILNREELKYSDKTVEAIKKKVKLFENEFVKFIEESSLKTDLRDLSKDLHIYKEYKQLRVKFAKCDGLFKQDDLPFIEVAKHMPRLKLDSGVFAVGKDFYKTMISGVHVCLSLVYGSDGSYLSTTKRDSYVRTIQRVWNSSNELIFAHNSENWVVSTKKKTLRRNERAFLNDHETDVFLYYDERHSVKSLVKHIISKNKNFTGGRLNAVTELYKELKRKVKSELFKSCSSLEGMDIPARYGLEERSINRKKDEDILVYFGRFDYDRTIWREDTLDKNYTYIYSNDNSDKPTLNRINAGLNKVDIDANVFKCAKKYNKIFGKFDNFIHIDDFKSGNKAYDKLIKYLVDRERISMLREEITNTSKYLGLKNLISCSIHKSLYAKIEQSENDCTIRFGEIIKSMEFIRESSYEPTLKNLSNQLLSPKELEELKLSVKKEFRALKRMNKFCEDFYIELEFLDRSYSSYLSPEKFSFFEKNIKMKQKLINKYKIK